MGGEIWGIAKEHPGATKKRKSLAIQVRRAMLQPESDFKTAVRPRMSTHARAKQKPGAVNSNERSGFETRFQ
jgi:hypothetical protein